MAPSDRQLRYEGDVYVRPIGRGIVLEDASGQPYLDEWLEDWLADAGFGRTLSGFSVPVRIVVEVASSRPTTTPPPSRG